MSRENEFERKEVIDASGLVASSWWRAATEHGPRVSKVNNGLKDSTRMTAAGVDMADNRIVLHVRMSEGVSSVRIGNIDMRAGAILHFSGGEIDTESILAAGVNLDSLAALDGVTEGPTEVSFNSVAADLQSV